MNVLESKLKFGAVQIFYDEVLGVGAYGKVCKAKYGPLPSAAKVLHDTLFQDNDPGTRNLISKFQQECQFLSTIKHPSIVQYLGTTNDPQSRRPVLLMELMDESLTKFLKRSHCPIPYHSQLGICHDVALALAYLHANAIVHRDLSSNNVLLIGEGNKAKVTDFGMSRLMDMNPQMTPLTQVPGTPAYMPPEALTTPPQYSNRLDCFSHGVLTLQIITGNFPDPGNATTTIEDKRFPTGRVNVFVPEADRRKKDIDLVEPTHPLLPIALHCLKDMDKERPLADELCEQLSVLKRESRYTQSVQQTREHLSTIKRLEDEITELKKKCAAQQEKAVTPPPPVPERKQRAEPPLLPNVAEEADQYNIAVDAILTAAKRLFNAMGDRLRRVKIIAETAKKQDKQRTLWHAANILADDTHKTIVVATETIGHLGDEAAEKALMKALNHLLNSVSSLVKMVGRLEAGVDDEVWFFDLDLSEKGAESILNSEIAQGKEGSFIVRNNEEDKFTLSVCHDRKVLHYNIKQSGNRYFISEAHMHSNVKELVGYHKLHSAGMLTRLQQPLNFSEQLPDEIDKSQLTQGKELSIGKFGCVLVGKWKDKVDVAIKKSPGETLNENFVLEAIIMKKFQHENLVKLYGMCTQGPTLIVREFMVNGPLREFLKQKTVKKNTLSAMSVQIASAMNYLERNKIVHCDLAARNCSVTEFDVVKIVDFTLAIYVVDDVYTAPKGAKFAIKWSPPEVLKYGRFSMKSDVWSFGIFLWELWSGGNPPYSQFNTSETLDKLKQGYRLEKPMICSTVLYDFMLKCWLPNPQDRPTFQYTLQQLTLDMEDYMQ